MQDKVGNLGVSLLRRFAIQQFTDCSIRTERRGARRKTTLSGRGINWGMQPAFLRGSDFAWREMLSVMALERDGLTNSEACLTTVEIIQRSEFGHLLGRSRRGRRRNGRAREVLDLAATVKGNVNRFKRRLLKLGYDPERMFEGWFGAFRANHARDAEWYVEAERAARKLIERIARPAW